MTQGLHRLSALLTALTLLLLTTGAAPRPVPDITELLGTWSGTGVYDGNELRLTRFWYPEMGGAVLRTDMIVDMPNGFSFKSAALWRPTENGYEVFLMDEGGRFELLQAVADAASGEITLEFVDRHTEDGPGERRSVYRMSGPDAYTEVLEGWTGEGWEHLADFSFVRTAMLPTNPEQIR